MANEDLSLNPKMEPNQSRDNFRRVEQWVREKVAEDRRRREQERKLRLMLMGA